MDEDHTVSVVPSSRIQTEQSDDLRTLMNQAPIGVVVVDMAGVVIDINAAAVSILGSPGKEASMGINVLTLPRLMANGVSDMFRQVIETGEPVEIESHYVSRWDKDVYLRARLSPRHDAMGRQTGVIQILEDVSEQKQAEARLERQLRYVRALAQCSQTLLQTPTDDEQQLHILNEALAPLVAGAKVGRAYIFHNFHDPELGDCMGIVAEACAPGVKAYIHTSPTQRASWSLVPEAMRRALEAGRPWGGGVAELWLDRPKVRNILLKQPLLSIQFFPIFFGDHWWGFVGFDDLETVRQWDDEEILLLGTAAEIFSSALQRWQSQRDLQKERDELKERVQARTAALKQTVMELEQEVAERQRAEKRLERRLQIEKMLAAAVARLMTEKDFGKAIAQTLQDVGEALDAAVTMLVRVDVAKRRVLDAIRWQAPDIQGMPPVSASAEAWIRRQMHSHKPIYLYDVKKQVDDDTVREELLASEIRAAAIYPLVVDEEIMGVFHVRLSHTMTKENAKNVFAILDIMADALNGLLQRQVLLENLEKRILERTRELTAVLDVAMLDVESADLVDVTAAMLPLISELARTQAISVHLFNEEGDLQLAAHQGFPAEEPPPATHFRGWPGTRELPLLATTPDAMAQLPYRYATRHFDTGLAVPIGGKVHPQGVLTCYRQGQGSFSLNQIALVTALADYMGTLIENHLLRQRVADAAIIEERQRLARDLHDSVSQSLYGVTLFARAGYNALAEEEWDKAKSDIARAEQNALQAIKEMRLLLYQLQPLALEGGLAQALQQRLDQVERRLGIQADCVMDPSIVLTRSMEGELYRLASEALNNALKHAEASKVSVRLEKSEGGVMLTISDDGRGFDPDRVKRGMGLDNMRHRAQRFGGRLGIDSQPGQGTVVRCVWDER